jgi:hypothetical protein
LNRRFTPPAWLAIVLVVTTAVSCWVAAERHKSESLNKAVHLVVDYPDVRQLAAGSSTTESQVLMRLKGAGVTGVAVAETDLDDLIADGRILLRNSNGVVQYAAANSETADWIARAMQARYPSVAGPNGAATLAWPDGRTMSLPNPAAIATFGLGIDQYSAKVVRDAGLSLIARLANPPVGNENSVADIVDDAKANGAEGMLAGGDEVLGNRELLPFAAERLRSADMWFGVVEFSQQGGLSRLLKEMGDKSLRVHSIVRTEMDRNEVRDIVDRYVRSAVERNVRVLFLRPPSNTAASPVDSFAEVITKIRKGIEREGFEAKRSHTDYPKETGRHGSSV